MTCGVSSRSFSTSATASAGPACRTTTAPPADAMYADYITRHIRPPRGIGPRAGWRGDGTGEGRGEPNPDQLAKYIENGQLLDDPHPEDA